MTMGSTFRFDHEPGDTPRDTESLNYLRSRGVKLGAHVTLWHCPACGTRDAIFTYPSEKEEA